MNRERPPPHHYNPYFERYIALITETDVLAVLAAQADELNAGLDRLTEERAAHRYAPGKWSVREVIGHLTDAERVFGYRALAAARGDTSSLPGFDENAYAAVSSHDRCHLPELLAELGDLRRSHVRMYRHMIAKDWDNTVLVAGHATSPRAIAFIMAGHVRHHARVLKERYGIDVGA